LRDTEKATLGKIDILASLIGCIIKQNEKAKTVKIVIDKDVVGELTEEGEIITNDLWLQKLADKIRCQKLTSLRSIKTKQGLYGHLVEVKRGDAGYVSAVANILLDNGYGLQD
jgi:hypothetical protein